MRYVALVDGKKGAYGVVVTYAAYHNESRARARAIDQSSRFRAIRILLLPRLFFRARTRDVA
jgi:hypothetical protein